jgi:hypothetical protein
MRGGGRELRRYKEIYERMCSVQGVWKMRTEETGRKGWGGGEGGRSLWQ